MKQAQRPISYSQIGVIHSPFTKAAGTPIQSNTARNAEGNIEIFKEYSAGLDDLDGFSHIMLLYHCHLAGDFQLKVKPFMDDLKRGVFSTRAPKRPNPIGISVVRLVRIEGNILYIRELDIIDGTPLLDIKPYVPEFDRRDKVRIGWLANNIGKLPTSKDDGRFI